jgi:DNA-binding response OmpR family regulator
MFNDKKHKVLIADDDSLVADVLSRKLITEGFEVVVVNDGQQALDRLKKEKFDLLLIDLTMPDVDGFQVLSEAQKMDLKMPILVMSNLSQPEDKKRAKDLGAWNYIVKGNVNTKDIVEEVRQCIIEHKC